MARDCRNDSTSVSCLSPRFLLLARASTAVSWVLQKKILRWSSDCQQFSGGISGAMPMKVERGRKPNWAENAFGAYADLAPRKWKKAGNDPIGRTLDFGAEDKVSVNSPWGSTAQTVMLGSGQSLVSPPCPATGWELRKAQLQLEHGGGA